LKIYQVIGLAELTKSIKPSDVSADLRTELRTLNI